MNAIRLPPPHTAPSHSRSPLPLILLPPGGVKSDIWRRSPSIVKWVVDSCFAPTSDGAEAIVFAANPPRDAPSPSTKQCAPLLPPPGMSENAKFYAKGFFAMSLVRPPLLPRHIHAAQC